MRRSTLAVAWFSTILSCTALAALFVFGLLVASGLQFGPGELDEGDMAQELRGLYPWILYLALTGGMAYALVRRYAWGWWGVVILLGALSLKMWWSVFSLEIEHLYLRHQIRILSGDWPAPAFGLTWLYLLVPTLCFIILLLDPPRRWARLAGRIPGADAAHPAPP